MQTDSRHIIHKLTLEVNTSSVELGYEIKNNVRSFIDAHVVPAIDNYFSGLTASMAADEVLRMDKLELTVNGGQNGWSVSGLGREIQGEFEKAVAATRSELMAVLPGREVSGRTGETPSGSMSITLKEAPKVENLEVFTKSKHGVLAWISFLSDGTTTWLSEEMRQSASDGQEQLLLQSIVESIETLNKKRELVFGASEARNRLIRQFSDDFLVALVIIASRNSASVSYTSVLTKEQPIITLLVRELLLGATLQTRDRFWGIVFRMLKFSSSQPVLSDEAFLLEMKQLFPQAFPPIGKDKSNEKQPKDKQSAGKKGDQGTGENVSAETGTQPGSEITAALNSTNVFTAGIGLLEWIHVLLSKSLSLKEYTRLQAVFTEKEHKSPTLPVDRTDLIQRNTDGQSDVKQVTDDPKKITASETDNLPNEKQPTPDEIVLDSSGNAEKPEQKPLPDSINSVQEQGDALFSTEKEPSALPAESADTAPALKIPQKENKQDAVAKEDVPATTKDTQLEEEHRFNVSESAETTASFHEQLSDVATEKPLIAEKLRENAQRPTKSFKDEQAQLLVENAGLIIIHPFLKHFFSGIGLLNEENKLTDKVLAAHALHYVATGREQDFEQAMSFEKYLVGIDPFESIPREIALSDAIKNEAENLLNAVRANWKPLQSSSITALRETFIQRPGKLINESPNPRLVVERKTVDVLMNQLSWTISIVRLPWLDELIFVEW